MATKNAVGNSLTGSTGSGAFVGATSPTLVTPTLGVASATSINFGQDPLNYYDEGTFTPTFSFTTPGDLSVSYAIQDGVYTRVGRQVFVYATIRFTPTHTTASGDAVFGGLPFSANASYTYVAFTAFSTPNMPTYVSGSFVYGNISGTTWSVRTQGSAVGPVVMGTTEFSTATQRTLFIAASYII